MIQEMLESIRDAKFKPGIPAGIKSGPVGLFEEPEIRVPGSSRARENHSQCIMY